MGTARIKAQETPPVCVAGWPEQTFRRRDGRSANAVGAVALQGLRAWSGANLDLVGLVELVLSRAQAAREDLSRALRLARALEAPAADRTPCARGLARLLEDLSDDLDARARWGEQSLFPRLLAAGAGRDAPRARLRERQAQASTLLDGLSGAVRDRQVSGDLCLAGRELLWACHRAEWSLRDHLRLESRLLAAATATHADGDAPRPIPRAPTLEPR